MSMNELNDLFWRLVCRVRFWMAAFVAVLFGLFGWILIFLTYDSAGWGLIVLGLIAAVVLVASVLRVQYDAIVVLDLPTEQDADPRDKSTWAAARIEICDAICDDVELVEMVPWDATCEKNIRVLVGPEPLTIGLRGALRARLLGTTSQYNPRYENEALV